jgi:hypothetical protein
MLIASALSGPARGARCGFLARVCTENLDSGVLVMQPAYEGMRNNAAGLPDWRETGASLAKER